MRSENSKTKTNKRGTRCYSIGAYVASGPLKSGDFCSGRLELIAEQVDELGMEDVEYVRGRGAEIGEDIG
jgi:hypothetical protein